MGETSKQQKDVDASSSDTTPEARARLVEPLAQREGKATFRGANHDRTLSEYVTNAEIERDASPGRT